MDIILQVKDLNISFEMEPQGFWLKSSKVINEQVIKNLSLNLVEGEILTIVGSSGSGKSVFASWLLDILPSNANSTGELIYKGEAQQNILGEAIYIPQSSSHLDPLMKVDRQFKLSDTPLGKQSKNLYPFQCSGGMIRNALFDLIHENPQAKIIIADEPTPGMDTATAVKTLQLLKDQTAKGKSVLLITHDIDLAMDISDRIAVFYSGTIIEIAKSEDFKTGNLRHHYSKALYNALPQNGFKPFTFTSEKEGCFCKNFCHKADEKCSNDISLMNIEGGYVRCANAPLW